MKEEFKRTAVALAKLQTHRTEGLYVDFLDLLTELREDIRIAQDTEPDHDQIFRNQGSCRTLSDLIDNMQKRPQQKVDAVIHDGGYTDI